MEVMEVSFIGKKKGRYVLRLIKAWVKNDFRLQCPPSKVRGIRVDRASNHSYLESRSRSS